MKKRYNSTFTVDFLKQVNMLSIEKNMNVNDLIESLLDYYNQVEELKKNVNYLDNYALVKNLKNIKI